MGGGGRKEWKKFTIEDMQLNSQIVESCVWIWKCFPAKLLLTAIINNALYKPWALLSSVYSFLLAAGISPM